MNVRICLSVLRSCERYLRLRSRCTRLCRCAFSAEACVATKLLVPPKNPYFTLPADFFEVAAGGLRIGVFHDWPAIHDFDDLVDAYAGPVSHRCRECR